MGARTVRNRLDFLLAPARLGLPGSLCSLPGLDFGRIDRGSHGERGFLKTVPCLSKKHGKPIQHCRPPIQKTFYSMVCLPTNTFFLLGFGVS